MKSEQIILSIIAILMFANTELFYYSSMSQYFLFGIASIVLFVIGLLHILRKSIRTISFIELTFFVWFIYIIVHNFTTNNEEYRLYYLICSYLFFQGIVWLFKSNRISIQKISQLFIGLSIYESVICLLQWIGILESGIPLFNIGGTWNSPNVSAMFISLCFPLLIEKILHTHNKAKVGYLFVTAFELSILLAINCRTAYIGLIFSSITLCGLHFKWFDRIKHIHPKRIIPIGLSIMICCILASYGLYKMKQPSADGRIFIWKTTVSMIAERPIKGYGYGMFEKEYYLQQNDYFQHEGGTENERKNARHIFMCYNDFLEQAAEGGIPSAMLYLSIIIIALFQSTRQKNYISVIFIVNIIWMSTVNFFIPAIPLMFILLVILAHTASNVERYIPYKQVFYTITTIGIMTLPVCTTSVINKYSVQRSVKRATNMRKQNLTEALEILKEQEKNAGTSECFWRIYGKFLLFAKEHENARIALERALDFTSNPSVYKDWNMCKDIQSKDK